MALPKGGKALPRAAAAPSPSVRSSPLRLRPRRQRLVAPCLLPLMTTTARTPIPRGGRQCGTLPSPSPFEVSLMAATVHANGSRSLDSLWVHANSSNCLTDSGVASIAHTFIQKTEKLYMDTRTQCNIVKLNDELFEVQQIMTRNVQEVLGVGEKLDQVSEMSSRLTSETRVYADRAKDLNRQALIRKWAPFAIVLGIVFLLFWVTGKIW